MNLDGFIDDLVILESTGDGAALVAAAKTAHAHYYQSLRSLLEALAAAIRVQGDGPPRSDAARSLTLKFDGYKLIVGWRYKTNLECWPDLINGQWIIQPNTRKYVGPDGNALSINSPLNEVAARIVDFFVTRYKRFNGEPETSADLDQMELMGDLGDTK